MRINKFIANSGISSRRKAEEFIRKGRVKVNDVVIDSFSIDIKESDIVKIDDKIIKIEEKLYFVFNKPKYVISSTKDPQKRKTILDYFNYDLRLFPVGRLDYESSGLIFVTNDGNFANKLTHPSYNKDKKYIVWVDNKLKESQIKEFKAGVKIDGRKTSKSEIKFLTIKNNIFKYRVIIHEGRNRQIRKMFKYFNINVIDLIRVEISGVKLYDLAFGKYRKLSKKEYNLLMEKK